MAEKVGVLQPPITTKTKRGDIVMVSSKTNVLYFPEMIVSINQSINQSIINTQSINQSISLFLFL